ncbi:MAG: site-specific DNA-methyltransferase [Thaumarchaeota archaeon]|nr:site-specific DNA-methyltransferase [Nitrososphaerota archaeon]
MNSVLEELNKNMKITIINKPVLEALKQIPDETIDCVITSPPYYGLRSYREAEVIWGGDPNCEHEWVSQEIYKNNLRFRDPNHKASVGNSMNQAIYTDPHTEANICLKCKAWRGQLGLEPDYHLYLDHLLLVTAELKRVMKPMGTLFWNQGDTYSGSGGAGGDYNAGGIREGQPKYKQGALSDIPPKSLMQLPSRFAIRMADEQGWILRNVMIWRKPNHMPSSVKDRLSNSYEHIFFFAKGQKYYFNLDAVRVPAKTGNGSEFGWVGINSKRMGGNAQMIKQVSKHIPKNNLLGKNPGDVLELSTQPFNGAHFATFPSKLPEFCIKAGCPVGGLVLDPFAGSGTTLMVAKRLGRSAIGIEISKEYMKLIKERVNWGMGLDVEWEER